MPKLPDAAAASKMQTKKRAKPSHTVLQTLPHKGATKNMKVLVGCEFSQTVTKAFRQQGHEAYSCDLLPTEGNPQWHLQMDVFEAIEQLQPDLGIFHPPCTHLAVSGARWFKEKQADGRQQRAINFFLKLTQASIDKTAIEQPISIMSRIYRKPDQIIQPWMFGHGETKATCLWLKNLPLLKPTNIVSDREGRVWREPPGSERWKNRSRTYEGIGVAMATQWGAIE